MVEIIIKNSDNTKKDKYAEVKPERKPRGLTLRKKNHADNNKLDLDS